MPTIESTIVEVTVFPDRARVTRRGTLRLEAGLRQVDFDDLPLTLSTDSIRVSGRGAANAALLGVDARRVYYSETPAALIKDLEQQIEGLNGQDKALADQAATAEVQAAFVQGLADKSAEQLARGLAFGRADIAQGDALLAFVQEQLNTAQATLRDIGLKRRELARQLEKLNNDLNARRSSRPRERYTATVEIDVKQAGELTIDLTYLVNSAGWGALYDLRLAEGDSPQVQLAYLGQVTQLSGEDWQDVALTLSTARPALATIKPKLQPWTISAYVPPPQAMPRARRMDVMQAVAAPAAPTIELAAGAAPEADMEAPAAQVSSAGASVTFRLAQSASIPSDGTPHKVNVAALEWSPQLDFISVPKLAEAAYRRAKIVNRSEYLLLPGQINLFVGGDYIGAAAIDRVAPNEEFELALGVDDRVVVKRELKAREVDKKLLADRRRIRAGYEIDLQNLHERPIDLEVHDQFPVAQHEQIKVRLESSDPKPDDQSEWNELEWHVALEPNEKRTLRFDFSIEYPTSMQVTGLP